MSSEAVDHAVDFPPTVRSMTYVREVTVNGSKQWALFNCDGEVLYSSENRSAAFFHAADIERRVVLLN